MPQENNQFILFFDGVCGLCNRSVNFLLNIDSKEKLLFSPLQGETAQNLLSANEIKDLDSLVVWKDGKTHVKSTAILLTLKEIGGIWTLLYIFIIIPPFIRDFIYNIIAKSRYQWFGKSNSCRMPSSSERTRFLP